mmetsp:Transcript_49669/g.131002  ORF Transcript_49669/g.131002 Transcript_49669/m.131002 type:complete len:80 (-) Transcript_49669:249-488(-)
MARSSFVQRAFGACMGGAPKAPAKVVRVTDESGKRESMSECSTLDSAAGFFELGVRAREVGQHRVSRKGSLVLSEGRSE